VHRSAQKRYWPETIIFSCAANMVEHVDEYVPREVLQAKALFTRLADYTVISPEEVTTLQFVRMCVMLAAGS
jgi:hypothetical protein